MIDVIERGSRICSIYDPNNIEGDLGFVDFICRSMFS